VAIANQSNTFGCGGSSSVITSPLSPQADGRQRANVSRVRRRWIREQGLLDLAPPVFIDETAVSTNMVRLYGRGRLGARVIDNVPQVTWKTITSVAALRHDKMVAPMAFDGADDRRNVPGICWNIA
jgi:hypothetical protein